MNHSIKEIVRVAMNKKICVITLIIISFVTIIIFDKQLSAVNKIGGENISALCYRCHDKLKNATNQMRYIHNPFKEGRCRDCHDPHVSDLKGLLRYDINELCTSCHNKIMNPSEKPFIHQALRSGRCTDCHLPHGSDRPKLLLKSEREICWQCHSSLKEEAKKTIVHSPYKNDNCSKCHEVHTSTNINLLKEEAQKLCQKCHTSNCKTKNVSLNFITKNMDCIICHTGHASEYKGLLGPYGHSDFLNHNCEKCHNPITQDKKLETIKQGKDLCLTCHRMSYSKVSKVDPHSDDKQCGCLMCHSSHASKRKTYIKSSLQTCIKLCIKCHEDIGKRINSMEKALKKIRCTPVSERKCLECHIPIHSQNRLYLRKDEIMTCARCHEAQHKIAHPLGPEVKDPRDGKPITCITCHSMHSAKADFMLYYDRKRQLCIQCHKK
jgi:predicted CXXCH cytochrome family protein